MSRPEGSLLDVPEKEREAYYEEIWQRGAFHYQMANWADVVLNPEANKVCVSMWVRP